jgi:hypothetical protein
MSGSTWRDVCTATKFGSEMRAHHSLETHRDLHTDHAGNLERISKMISFGNETASTVHGARRVLLLPRAGLAGRG